MFLIHNLNVYIHHYHQIWTLSFLPASSPCPIIKSNKLASKPRYYFLHFEMESCKSSCNSDVMEGTKGCQKNLITVFNQDFWGTGTAWLSEHSRMQHLSTNWREKTCVNTQIGGPRWTRPSQKIGWIKSRINTILYSDLILFITISFSNDHLCVFYDFWWYEIFK